MQSILDATQPKGRRCHWKSEYLPKIEPAMLARAVEHAKRIVSPYSAVILFPVNGAPNRLPEDHCAAGNRGAACVLKISASRDKAEDDGASIEWARTAWQDRRHIYQLSDGRGGREAHPRCLRQER